MEDAAVAGLEWLECRDGFVSGIYRIRRTAPESIEVWQLEVSAGELLATALGMSPAPTTHRTLAGARAAARHIEGERIGRLRTKRHLAIGAGATLAFLAGLTLATNVWWFMATMGMAALALGTAARGVDIKLGAGWGSLYSQPDRITWLDRIVVPFVERLTPRTVAADPAGAAPKVWVLPPE